MIERIGKIRYIVFKIKQIRGKAMDIKNVYKQLTNVDIEEQKRLWDERGKGYYGEYLVFCELYKKISGNCKILMNLNIPTENGGTTEIDLLLIHETGIYVFEIKHYKGTIYGDDKGAIWTQYFRTVKNNTFKNPILQNEYHIKAIKRLFPDMPIKSIIVFTSYECDVRVQNANDNIDICELHNLNRNIVYRFKSNQQIYSMEEIDTIFDKLSKYSHMQEMVEFEGKEEPFISWLQPIIFELEKEKKNVDEALVKTNKTKRKCVIGCASGCITNIIVGFICVLALIGYMNKLKEDYNLEVDNIKKDYNQEIEKFKQKFKHIDEIENKYIDIVNEYVDVTNISLTDNSVTFSAKLSMNNDEYGIALTEDSKYTVMTNNGQVFEYDVFGKHLGYNRFTNMIGKGIRDYGNLAQAKFYGVNKEDISYIKLINIELFKLDSSRTIVKENLEIELYNKSDSK